MAVSGRKAADFRGSVSRGSTEDVDHCCEPCLTEGQHIEAFRYCISCQEYLCKNCVRYHQKTKILKHHQLIEKDKVDSHKYVTGSSETYTEKCSTHTEEIVKFFCPEHEALGCTDCMTMGHRTCKLDYIPDKCKDVGNSEEYRETMNRLDEKLTHLDYLRKKATVKDKEIDFCHDKVVQDIVQYRSEITDHLDMLQKEVETAVGKQRSKGKQKMQNVLANCSKISSEIKQVQTNLQSRKLAMENYKLFIGLIQAKQKLQSAEVNETEIILEKLDTHYTFERNKDINNILSEQTIGKLSKISKPLISKRNAVTLKYQYDKDVNIRTKTDKYTCSIRGCAVLSREKVVLTDSSNFKVKVADIKTNVVIDEMTLADQPTDVAVVTDDQVAVTVTNSKKILIMTTSDQLKTIRTIHIKRRCYCIICHEGSLVVLCHCPNSLLILDLQGNVKRTVPLSDILHGNPYEIAYSRDQKLLYISDCTSHSIVSISLKGEVRASLTDKELGATRGMLVLDDGSLLVCSNDNNIIYKVSGEMKQKQKIVDNVDSPCCIVYNESRNEIFIGGLHCNILKTFLVSHTC